MVEVNEMEYIYAALLLHKLGKEINENNIKAIITSVGGVYDEAKAKVVVNALQGVNIDEAIKKGLQSMTVAAPVQQTTQQAPVEQKKEESQKEEKKEEENLAGLASLFG